MTGRSSHPVRTLAIRPMFPGFFERPLVALTDSRGPVCPARTASLTLVVFGVRDRVGELVQVGTDDTQEA